MTASQQKIVQYLNEAQASERALTRVLQSQIAMTPRAPTAPDWRPISTRHALTPSASVAGWRSSAKAAIPSRRSLARPRP